ncbi:MAG: glycosyltransferase family 2 protein [Bacteroidetes bacterium]|nr:glycosyltransferase family 2 protein [Bacteroidota bacterium]
MNRQKSNIGISVIIPAYNEEESIIGVITKIRDNLKIIDGSCEIIVVNDGSTDNTGKVLETSKMNIKLLTHERNVGYGAALKTGIKNAEYENIVITDADGTYPNERILDLVHTLEEGGFDMVVGARTGKNAKIPLVRRPAKWVITKLANYLSGTKIPDLNSGLRVMRKEVVNKFMNILPDGFSFTSTITLALLTNGYSVKYVPIDYFKRKGKSKIRPIYDTFNFIQLIIRTVLYFNPLKVFFPLSLFLVLIAFLILIVSLLLTVKGMDVTFGVILMTAVIVITIGMLADLIDKRMK